MSNTPHTLGEEFPGQLGAIHALKASDPQFARLLAEYDEINDRVHRAESRLDTLSEAAEAGLRRARLTLKDAIAAALASNAR
jgi:uncharacterized protein YdcH (DUF465 family)